MNFKRLTSWFVLLITSVFLLSCARANVRDPSPVQYDSYEITFRDAESGELLTEGYVVSSVSKLEGSNRNMFEGGWKYSDGPERLYKIGSDGTVEIETAGWDRMGFQVFISGHKFHTNGSPFENKDDVKVEQSGNHLKVYLPDVRGDYEEISDLYTSVFKFSVSKGDPIYIDGKKRKVNANIKKDVQEFVNEVKKQYETAEEK